MQRNYQTVLHNKILGKNYVITHLISINFCIQSAQILLIKTKVYIPVLIDLRSSFFFCLQLNFKMIRNIIFSTISRLQIRLWKTLAHRPNLATPFVVNKLLLKHSHSHLLTWYLGLLLHFNGQMEQLQQKPCIPESLKYLLPGLLQKGF